MTNRRTLTLAVVAALACLSLGCESSGDPTDGGGAGDGGGRSNRVDVAAELGQLATDVLVPAYERLGEALDDLVASVDALCDAPGADALDGARDSWRHAADAWQRTRAVGVGPAMDARLMSSVGFAARAHNVEELLAGDDPVDREAVAGEGASVRGLYSLEVALFGPAGDVLAGPDGARRCTYAASVAALAADAAAPVVDAWTDGSAGEQLAAGLDGGPRSSVAELVNQVSWRLKEVDERGLRDVAAAESLDDLADARLDGPAAWRVADLRSVAAGATAAIGDREVGLVALVAGDDDLVDRVLAARDRVEETMAVLPDSVADSLAATGPVTEAADAVAELQVLVSTELAAQLGITISFSDSDGDA